MTSSSPGPLGGIADKSPESSTRVHRMLIVGERGSTNIGESFERAALELGFEVKLLESRLAMQAPAWIRKVNWWMLGHRPTRLGWFGRETLRVCESWMPNVLVATGPAPLDAGAMERIGTLGIRRLIYLTDDPYNPCHRSGWFLRALPHYDEVFTPRRANIGDLKKLGCREIKYLPFAYDEALCFPEHTANGPADDVIFVGGADRDRLPYIAALIDAGFHVALYGAYWERYRETREYSRGHASPRELRAATAKSKVTLCLVRRSNRDGHCMRSFEAPAMGTCMLVEDTAEHRAIFGGDGKSVVYFGSIPQMTERLRWLLEHNEERLRLSAAVQSIITEGQNTYKSRLVEMLGPNE